MDPSTDKTDLSSVATDLTKSDNVASSTDVDQELSEAHLPKREENTNDDKLNKEQQASQNKNASKDSVGYESIIDHKDLTYTIWGDNVKQDVFERWSQGFIFDNKKEPTALLQYNGGPCSVIGCVQAFLLKELLFCTRCGNEWKKPTETELNQHLSDALLSIFINVSSDNPKYLVFYEENFETTTTETPDLNCDSNVSKSANQTTENSANTSGISIPYNPKRAKLDYDAFTNKLRVFKFETLNELKIKLYQKVDQYKKEYGVLCFLYSLLLTKKLDILKKELEEAQESLIDPLHGHGSQCLTNLMLCGVATSNVFDGDRCLEGLELHGIHKQSSIGFLTIMEYLRYCEVGWNLKNPKYPIFILASETHLTVFFSKETSLVQKNESNRQMAIKKFQIYDPYENGFVKTEDLDKLMESLDLLTDKEYVEVVKQQLDTENLGIITKTAFLNEFYPESEPAMIPNTFQVYHYNGLVRSNSDNEVQYAEGVAKIIDFTDQPGLDLNSIKNCLQTKWPTIEIEWKSARPPSLN